MARLSARPGSTLPAADRMCLQTSQPTSGQPAHSARNVFQLFQHLLRGRRALRADRALTRFKPEVILPPKLCALFAAFESHNSARRNKPCVVLPSPPTRSHGATLPSEAKQGWKRAFHVRLGVWRRGAQPDSARREKPRNTGTPSLARWRALSAHTRRALQRATPGRPHKCRGNPGRSRACVTAALRGAGGAAAPCGPTERCRRVGHVTPLQRTTHAHLSSSRSPIPPAKNGWLVLIFSSPALRQHA